MHVDYPCRLLSSLAPSLVHADVYDIVNVVTCQTDELCPASGHGSHNARNAYRAETISTIRHIVVSSLVKPMTTLWLPSMLLLPIDYLHMFGNSPHTP
jgi:hypothetical protein